MIGWGMTHTERIPEPVMLVSDRWAPIEADKKDGGRAGRRVRPESLRETGQ